MQETTRLAEVWETNLSAAAAGGNSTAAAADWMGVHVTDPPSLLFYIMGAWSCITGITGFIANAIAIFLYFSSKRVGVVERIVV